MIDRALIIAVTWQVRRKLSHGLAALLVLVSSAHAAEPGTPSTEVLASSVSRVGWYGVAGCAAAGCHGNGTSRGGQFTHWFQHDKKHVEAYLTLSNEKSTKMVQALGRKGDATQQRDCLACHSMSVQPGQSVSPIFAVDYGVGCESCHGPAAGWISEHTQLDVWQQRLSLQEKEAQGLRDISPGEKHDLGFRDTRDLFIRSQRCAECHVGSKHAVVDHDLIAAGHPALQFEMTSFQSHQPAHWTTTRPDTWRAQGDPKYAPDYEARLWLVGQIASTMAALEVIEARLDKPTNPGMIELAEHNCHACHHDLAEQAWRRPKGPSSHLGLPVFGTWYLLPVRRLAEASHELLGVDAQESATHLRLIGEVFHETKLATLTPDQIKKLKDEIDQAKRTLKNWGNAINDPKQIKLDEPTVLKLLNYVATEQPEYRSWDDATQRYLATASLVRALEQLRASRPTTVDEPLKLIRDALYFRPHFSTPEPAFAPGQVDEAFGSIRKIYTQP
jgi:hypothetical protein